MSEPQALPTALSATAKLKQRDDAIRANGIKEGRKLERQEIIAGFAPASIEEMSELAHLRRELKERPTAAEVKAAKAHGYHLAAWQFGLAGTLMGALMSAMALIAMTNVGVQQLREFGAGMVLSGAATQQLNPPARCVPGENLPDGRVCPGR